MNCVRCNTLLETNARFCRNCGLPVAASQPQETRVSPPQQMTENITPVPPIQDLPKPDAPLTPLYLQQTRQQQAYQQQQARVQSQTPFTPQSGQMSASTSSSQPSNVSQSQEPSPLEYYQPRNMSGGAKTLTAAVNAPPYRNPLGCVLWILGVLVVLFLVLAAAWIFAVRPYIHEAAINQMNNAMTSEVNQIPATGILIPPGATLPISEGTLNALLANHVANSDAVQDPNMQIMPNGILLDFKLYGQDCTITGVPQAQDGTLVAKNVTVSGIMSLVLSSKDITTLLNNHLKDAQIRINHPITGVRLMDHEMDLTLG